MNVVRDSCVLCSEPGGALIWQRDSLRVVLVDEPDLPGYTRVIWQSHVAEMTELAEEDRQRVMQTVFLVEAVQRRVLQADKVNLASLGNMTPHLHWHVMPRWRADPWFPDSIWATRSQRRDAQLTQWKQLREALVARQGEYTESLRDRLTAQFGPCDAAS